MKKTEKVAFRVGAVAGFAIGAFVSVACIAAGVGLFFDPVTLRVNLMVALPPIAVAALFGFTAKWIAAGFR